MAIRDAIVARANAIVGMSRDQLGMSGSYAWCCHTVSNVLRFVGINNMYDLSCNSMKKKMSESKEWDEPEDNPIPGDILYFDWDRERDPEYYTRPLDHIGIVVGYSKDGTITYVNGNGDSSYYVTKQTINVNNPSVQYWMRYVGEEAEAPKPVQNIAKPLKKYCTVELEVLSKGSESATVETVQNLLIDLGYNIEADGIFGSETDKIVRKFQKDYSLAVDGIVGAKTYKALIEAV